MLPHQWTPEHFPVCFLTYDLDHPERVIKEQSIDSPFHEFEIIKLSEMSEENRPRRLGIKITLATGQVYDSKDLPRNR